MSTLKADSIQPTNNGNNLIFKTGVGDAERMRISNSGIISVGNFVTNYTNTSYRMQVSGSASGDSGISINLAQNESPYGFGVGNVTANSGSGAGDAPHATIYSAANKDYAASAFALGFQNSASVNSGSGFTPLLIGFNASSRIGIGTTAPGASLDVNGDIKSSTYVRATSGMVIGGVTFAAPSGTAPIFGARAWVAFDGTDLSGPGGSNKIWGKSSNIDYVGRPGDGLYSVYLKTGQELPDVTGAAFASAWTGNNLAGANQMANAKVQATNRIDVTVVDVSNVLQNNNYITMVVFS